MSSAVSSRIKRPFLFPQQVRGLDNVPSAGGESGGLTAEEGAGDAVPGAEDSSGTENSDK